MSHPSVSEQLFRKTAFTKACHYCGAHFRVLLTQLPEGNEAFDYACPECGKQYEAEAALEPQVNLLQARTDGKTDRYQETMF
jgi:uncharacterized Zn-finger protein